MKLIIEPDAGIAPLLAAIKAAKKSVEIAVFRFDRKDIEVALKTAAAQNKVKVSALIAEVNRGGEKNLRKLETRFLEVGITVARTSGDLIRYHDKFILIDRRILLMCSFNFTHLDIDHSRGFGIISTHVKWAKEAAKLFRADCMRSPYVAGHETFVVSPANARKVLGTFLGRAKKQLLIYDPMISDKEMLGILRERVKAGVDVRIIGKVHGGAKFNVQALAGCRLHTRTIIRDHRQAFIGSQSLRAAELDLRRELGLIVRDAKCVHGLLDTFESDWARGQVATEPARPTKREARANADAAASEQLTEKAVHALEKDLNPLAASVKKAVTKAVARADEDVLSDREVEDTVKRVVKKAMKQAVHQPARKSPKRRKPAPRP